MDGIYVLEQVLEKKLFLDRILQLAVRSDMEGQAATLVRDLKDYNEKLTVLISFLNKNTSSSLTFKKNVINVLFKNSNIRNANEVKNALKQLLMQQTRIINMTTIEINFAGLDMQLAKIRDELTKSYITLTVFFQKLEKAIEKKEESEFSKKDLDAKVVDNLSDLFVSTPKKSPLISYFRSRGKASKKMCISEDNGSTSKLTLSNPTTTKTNRLS